LAGGDRRRTLAQFGALAVGALFVGLLRATNTWDWPTFLLLGGVGLSYAWWLAWKAINRWSLLNFALRVGGFGVMSFLFVLPYTTWYAATYGSIHAWTGGKTPLWAYAD